MNGSAAEIFIDGTSALNTSVLRVRNHQPRIIPFPRKERAAERISCTRPEREGASHGRATARSARNRGAYSVVDYLREVLYASEMFCSLKREDARGVLYNVFSKRNIWTLTAASCVVAAIAIAFGA